MKTTILCRSRRGAWALGGFVLSLGLAAGAAGLAMTRRSAESATPAADLDRLSLAKIAFTEGDWARCEANLREALAARPDDRDARLLLGAVLCERGRLIESKDMFSAALKNDLKSYEAARGLAKVHAALGQTGLAVLYYEKAAALRRDAQSLRELGISQYRKGDARGALSSLQQARAMDPAREDLDALFQEILAAQAAPGSPLGGPHRGASFSPPPQPPDPRALDPVPQPPDPAKGFPQLGGRNR